MRLEAIECGEDLPLALDGPLALRYSDQQSFEQFLVTMSQSKRLISMQWFQSRCAASLSRTTERGIRSVTGRHDFELLFLIIFNV